MKHNPAAETHSQRPIITVAKDLFHQQGVRATNVDEIVQAARISPREYYRSFRSKNKLSHEVILTYLAEIESGSSPLHPKLASWSDFKRSLAKHVTFLSEFHMLRGCPLAIIGNELTEKDEAIRQDLNLVFEALKERIATFLKKEKLKARLLPTADEEQLAEFCVAAMQGAMLIGKVRRDSQTVTRLFEDVSMHLSRYKLHTK